MNNKSITLRAFVVENKEVTSNSSDVLEKMISVLNESKAQDRRMILNNDDPKKEEDLICDFDISNEALLTGAMLRIFPGSEDLKIPDSLFSNDKIVLSTLDSGEVEEKIVYKDHYYFLLDNSYLITNLQRNITISRFQTYINWLLRSVRSQKIYEFTPMIEIQEEIKMSDIKSIKVVDPISEVEKDQVSRTSDFMTNLKKLTGSSLSFLFKDIETIDEIKLEDIVAADLILKFSKPKEMSEDSYQKSFGAYMKPISETDHIHVITKKGTKLSGKDILKTKKVDVELLDSGKISEKSLMMQMELFLRDLKNAEKQNN